MLQQQLLKKVIQVLEQTGIEYMITGSVASSLQGEPRSTHDIDIVITIDLSSIREFVEKFPSPDYYLEEDSIHRAIETRTVFSLIDVKSGYKVDFWMLTEDLFDQTRFSRKSTEEVFGLNMKVSAPEDTILMKLRWAQLSGGSEKQFRDALRVYEVQSGNLDLSYLDQWVKWLGVKPLWEQLTNEAEQTPEP